MMTNFLTSSKLQSCDFSFVLVGVFKLSKPVSQGVVLCKLFFPQNVFCMKLSMTPRSSTKVIEHCGMVSDKVDAIARVQSKEC